MRRRAVNRTVYGYGRTLYGKYTATGPYRILAVSTSLSPSPVRYGNHYGRYTGQDGCTGQGNIEKS